MVDQHLLNFDNKDIEKINKLIATDTEYLKKNKFTNYSILLGIENAI